MAKAPENEAISEDSIAYLEEVKKGKPRKFAMICKGTNVVSLVIYKKGNVEKRKKEAKEAGKGQFYFGVVDGKGVEIRFVLARSDGFESPPIKNSVLKGFLEESADMKCKPYFEIVDSAQMVLDDSDPLVLRFIKLQEAALKACDSNPDRSVEINGLCKQIGGHLDQEDPDAATPKIDALEKLLAGLVQIPEPSGTQPSTTPPPANAPAPPSDGAVQFMNRLKALKPSIDAAVATPDANPEIKLRFSEAAVFARKKEFEPANKLLDEVENLLKSAPPVAPPPPSDEQTTFMNRLKACKTEIEKAIAAPGANPDIKLRFSEAAVFARKREFDQANLLLDQVESLLKSSAPPIPPDTAAATFMTRLKARKPDIDKAIAAPGANPDIKLRFSEAAVFARKKEFEQANLLLDQVEKLLSTNPSNDQLPSESSSKEGISLVELGKARIEWDVVRKQALRDIQQLKALLQATYGNDASEQQAHSIAMQRLDSTIASINEELSDRLDDVLNAEPTNRSGKADTAKQVLKRFVDFVESDELMSLIDNNEYAPDMLVAKPLRSKLKDIESALV